VGLAGQGASASAPPGLSQASHWLFRPNWYSASLRIEQSATTPVGQQETSTSAAVPLTVNGLFVLLAAALGMNLANIAVG